MHDTPVQPQMASSAPSLSEDIARCVHCGFCLQACPTYLQLGMETDSPRGRIALIDAIISGRAAPTRPLLKHLDQCLQCRACETACPSGVPYGRIMEAARAEVIEAKQAPLAWQVRVGVLRALLPHRGRLRALFAAGRLYQRWPVRSWLQASRILNRIVPPLAAVDASLPALPSRPFMPPEQPEHAPSGTVALLTGCVMPHLYPRTHEATIRVLNRLGYRVVMPDTQTCCGALNFHAGDRRFARDLARQNIDAMLRPEVKAIIVNSAGCGSTMKEYGHLLASDSDYAERAASFAAKTKDVLEFVASHKLGDLQRVGCTVTYQDSCHLVHAQRVPAAPRVILQAIPGVELREMASPDRCCGSAGIYSIVQRDLSGRILDDKMDDIERTGASVIATVNPGCMTQLEAGARLRGLDVRVVHVIELLDEAMQASAR